MRARWWTLAWTRCSSRTGATLRSRLARVEPATVAALTVVAHEIRRACPTTPLGINVLKSDARAALAVACAVGARFIRVNVHAGAVVADQGLVQSDAYHTLRDRRLLSAAVEIYADVGGKHSTPLAPLDFELQARDLVHRGLADGLVVSGRVTGRAHAARRPQAGARRRRRACRLLVGSGATPETIAELLSIADGAIVGTSLKHDGDVDAPVDPARVRRLVAATRSG